MSILGVCPSGIAIGSYKINIINTILIMHSNKDNFYFQMSNISGYQEIAL